MNGTLLELRSSMCTDDFIREIHPREQNFHPVKCFMIFDTHEAKARELARGRVKE